jgi:hypothetical protein
MSLHEGQISTTWETCKPNPKADGTFGIWSHFTQFTSLHGHLLVKMGCLQWHIAHTIFHKTASIFAYNTDA